MPLTGHLNILKIARILTAVIGENGFRQSICPEKPPEFGLGDGCEGGTLAGYYR